MRDFILARRYATAVFELASDNNVVDRIGRELGLVEDMILKYPVWIQLLQDKEIKSGAKRKMVDEVAHALKFHQITGNFLKVLIERKRMLHLQDIISSYKKEVLVASGEVEATVTVADEKVWEGLSAEVKRVISKITGKKVVLSHRVDTSIIGGLIISHGGKLYDGSIRGELRRMRRNLSEKVGEVG